jgi:hypothetical protein
MNAGFEGFAWFVLALPRLEHMKYATDRISPLLLHAIIKQTPQTPQSPHSVKTGHERCSSKTRRLHLPFAFQADDC